MGEEDDVETKIKRCYSESFVLSAENGRSLVGMTYINSVTEESYSAGGVTGSKYVGGLVGQNGDSAKVNKCYSRSSVLGGTDVGGLVGWVNERSFYHECYSTGAVNGTGEGATNGRLGRKKSEPTPPSMTATGTLGTGRSYLTVVKAGLQSDE